MGKVGFGSAYNVNGFETLAVRLLIIKNDKDNWQV